MMTEVMSGKYPSDKYRSDIQVDDGGEEDLFIRTAAAMGKRCARVCCNGAFIVETMLKVIINDEIRELVFVPETTKRMWRRRGIGDYVPFNYPALLAVYANLLATDTPRDDETGRPVRPPALEKLKIGKFDYRMINYDCQRV